MRNFLSILLIIGLTLGLMFNDAQAKRFGGGRSFGMQRSSWSSGSSVARIPQQPFQTTQRPSMASRFLGPLAGLAAGGLLASLFMGNGLGSGILSWLAIAGVGLLIWNLFRNKIQNASQSSYQYDHRTQNNPLRDSLSQFMQNNNHAQPNTAQYHPQEFNTDAFLRDVKGRFIRLQAAFDSKDLRDLREFTTPEVFAEIKLQLQERGDADNQTEVVTLNAELLDMSTDQNAMDAESAMIASVRFSGLIREEKNESPISLNEIWHFRKDADKTGWMVAGIQQH